MESVFAVVSQQRRLPYVRQRNFVSFRKANIAERQIFRACVRQSLKFAQNNMTLFADVMAKLTPMNVRLMPQAYLFPPLVNAQAKGKIKISRRHLL